MFLVKFFVFFLLGDLHNLFAQAEDTILCFHWLEIQKEKFNLLDSVALWRVKETQCSDVLRQFPDSTFPCTQSLSLHDIARCLHDFRGHLRCGKWAVLPGRVFRIFGRLVFHVLTAPVFQTG